MWIKAKIKVLSDERNGTSRTGNDWKSVDMVLEYAEYDSQGKPLMDEQTNKPVISKVSISAFNERVDELKNLGLKLGDEVWADLRCWVDSKQSSRGTWYVQNNITVRQFMRI